MTRPNIQIGDEVREMTKSEHESWLTLCAEIEAQTVAIETMAAAKVSARNKLKTLGLTDDEIVALVG